MMPYIFFKPRYLVFPNLHVMFQVWILYFLECPYHTQHVKFNDVFNWTATYRRDSDIVAPYERWAYYDDSVKQNLRMDHNYAVNKTKKVSSGRKCRQRDSGLALAAMRSSDVTNRRTTSQDANTLLY